HINTVATIVGSVVTIGSVTTPVVPTAAESVVAAAGRVPNLLRYPLVALCVFLVCRLHAASVRWSQHSTEGATRLMISTGNAVSFGWANFATAEIVYSSSAGWLILTLIPGTLLALWMIYIEVESPDVVVGQGILLLFVYLCCNAAVDLPN
ncbi:MAG: hypothetical protein AB7K71_04390, partial [Polyangiaceae bacterium]